MYLCLYLENFMLLQVQIDVEYLTFSKKKKKIEPIQ